jgi:Gpi18-like mannosyltransferase
MIDARLRVLRKNGLLLTAVVIVVVRVAAAIFSAQWALTLGKTGPWFSSLHTSVADLLEHWDAGWYIGIAKSGYSTVDSHAFFPAYPLLIRSISSVFGYPNAALAVSWLAAVFAIWGVLDVAQRFVSFQSSALIAALLLAWNPVSIFFVAGYPEGLLVATMIWSLRFCLDKKWWQAATLAALASLAMPQGVVSALVLGLAVLLSDRRWVGLLRSVFYVVLGELGLLSYVVYCGVTTGNPLIFQSATKSGWNSQLTYPFHTVFVGLNFVFTGALNFQFNGGVTPQIDAVLTLNALAGALGAVFMVAGLYLCWRDRGLILPATLLALGVLVSVITIEPSLESTGRFILFLAPLYVIVAVLLDRLPRIARLPVGVSLLLVSVLLSVLFGVMFNLGWWLT